MHKRLVTAFVAGVLCTVILLTAAFGAFSLLSDDAHAQESGWTVKYIPDAGYNTQSVVSWVETVPSNCDIVPTSQPFLFLVRCK